MIRGTKPKFAFELTIKELANIPQVGGSCYVEIHVRDGKLMKPFSGMLDRKPPKEADLPSKNTELDASGSSSKTGISGGNVSTVTSAKHIHNFRCAFDYKMRCNLKFSIRRRDNMIDNKYLHLRVFYVNDQKEVTPLGRLEVNLTEYLNYSKPQTSKYLLKHSKVNSLLSLTIFLSELPSNFDFHTQLQVNESVSQVGGMTPKPQLRHSTSNGAPSGTFSIPQFGENFSTGGKSGNQKKPPSPEEKKQCKVGLKLRGNKNQNDAKSEPINDIENESNLLIMDPIVNKLYSRIMESTWDPELHALLEYSPEQSIEDIFHNPENPLGLNEKLLETYITWSKDQRLECDADGNELLEVNGLINEKVFRSDLKSWAVR